MFSFSECYLLFSKILSKRFVTIKNNIIFALRFWPWGDTQAANEGRL
jgi:hypothetical protein